MINVLELRANPLSKSNGIDRYCKALRELFADDDEISILPVENYPMKRDKLFKEKYDTAFLREIVNNKSIDVVHINGYASFSVMQSFLLAKKANKKIVFTAHWHPFGYLSHPLRAKLFFYVLLKPIIKKYADVVVTINNEDTAFFKGFHKKVFQIPHWIESKSIKANIDKKEPKLILFVGRLNDQNKGAEHLLMLPKGKYDIHCVGPSDGDLRSDITNHVNISFEELSLLYRKASLVVVPSRYEAFSYVAMEALSLGTPVLLSERVRIADYLDGVEGVYTFNYHNQQDFCDRVEASLGKSVDVKRVLEVLSQDRMKRKYRDLFLSLSK